MSEEKQTSKEPSENLDPLSGEHGAHPVGTGIGAAGAGATGAVIGGAVGGPVGAVVGSVVGAFAGGLAGKSVAESVNPTIEDDYWRDNYITQPYYDANHQYEDYQPAYRTGYEGYTRYSGTGRTYDELEPDLQRDYETNSSGSKLGWEKAKHATRDAWHKVERAIPGDADRNRR